MPDIIPEEIHENIMEVYAMIREVKREMATHIQDRGEIHIAFERLDEARLWFSEGYVNQFLQSNEQED